MACPLENVLRGVEALTLLRGFELVELLGCASVDVDFDSLELIQTCDGSI
jgi:hypothetical protein